MEQIVRLTKSYRGPSLRARILARAMRAVLTGDRQAIAVTLTDKDIRAAQALLQLAGRADRDHAIQGRCALSLIHG